MTEKLEQSKEFIEELYELAFHDTDAWVLTAMNTILDNGKKFPLLFDLLFKGSPIEDKKNQLTFAKIWAGEIELVEKEPKYVIYQIDDECNPWLLGIGVYGTLKNLPDFNANQPCEHGDYANKNCHFDQKFAFAMRDTGEFKIEEVVE